MGDERLLTVDDVADRLRVHPETVRRLLRTRRLAGTQPVSKRGGWRIAERDLARFLAAAPIRAAQAPALRPKQNTAVLVANFRAAAEQARASGDEKGARRYEDMAVEAAGAAGIAQSAEAER